MDDADLLATAMKIAGIPTEEPAATEESIVAEVEDGNLIVRLQDQQYDADEFAEYLAFLANSITDERLAQEILKLKNHGSDPQPLIDNAQVPPFFTEGIASFPEVDLKATRPKRKRNPYKKNGALKKGEPSKKKRMGSKKSAPMGEPRETNGPFELFPQANSLNTPFGTSDFPISPLRESRETDYQPASTSFQMAFPYLDPLWQKDTPQEGGMPGLLSKNDTSERNADPKSKKHAGMERRKKGGDGEKKKHSSKSSSHAAGNRKKDVNGVFHESYRSPRQPDELWRPNGEWRQ